MRFTNTLTGHKEEFSPIEAGKVRMYVCGPTVYNHIHIGNARPAIIFDTLRNYLEYLGLDVTYVSNFTDIDDKIINKANQEGLSSTEIAERYILDFQNEMKNLKVRPATISPRVTEEIDGIIAMIEKLIAGGFAYLSGQTVYFDAANYKGYGKLSRRKLNEMMYGARIDVEEGKKSPLDFVLWKPAKPGEPYWSSPWGDGRPGWHIECSVMAGKYLGETIDIHAGGDDLIFPHHENELAQSEAANGKPFVHYWLHNGMVNVNNQKMSKSKGNFFLLREIAEKFPYDVIRFFVLSAHYRMPVNFSEELLQSAQNGLSRIRNAMENARRVVAAENPAPPEHSHMATAREFMDEFCAAMDDDLNTANAITALFELAKFSNTHLQDNASMTLAQICIEEMETMCRILGITEESKEINPDFVEQVEALIEQRTSARNSKDFKLSDEIRDKLAAMNVEIKDTREGTSWTLRG